MSGPDEKYVVMSHADDTDGVGSALLVTKYLLGLTGVMPEVVFIKYDQIDEMVPQKAAEADELWLTDLSFRNLDLIEPLRKFGKERLFFFDHHGSSCEFAKALEGLATIGFIHQGTHCAADLVFEFVAPKLKDTDEYPWLEKLRRYTHSRDLWIRDEPNGDAFQQIINVLGPDRTFTLLNEDIKRIDPENWNYEMRLAKRISDERLQESLALAKATAVRSQFKPGHPFAGFEVIAAMTNGDQSEAGEMLLGNRTGCVGLLTLNRQGMSLRTNERTFKEFNLGMNTLAEKLGGGGHPCAAGAPPTVELLCGGSNALFKLMHSLIEDELEARMKKFNESNTSLSNSN